MSEIDTLIEFLQGMKEKGYTEVNTTVIFQCPRLETEYRLETVAEGSVGLDIYDNHNFAGLHHSGSVEDALYLVAIRD